MRHAFYDSPAYKQRQRERTKALIEFGKYDHLKKRTRRLCLRFGCENTFVAILSNPKKFCSRKCAALTNSPGRTLAKSVKEKISKALLGKPNPYKGVKKVPLVEASCAREGCETTFLFERFKRKRFCSAACAAKRPTSPRASRGKAGIRPDISLDIYFYSRWEANMARLYTHLGIKWEYAPRTFDIGGHTYTPDFYLPDSDTFVEVKNFLGEYSKRRDERFREAYPTIKLQLLLRDDYLALEEKYGKSIQLWEYRNSKLLF